MIERSPTFTHVHFPSTFSYNTHYLRMRNCRFDFQGALVQRLLYLNLGFSRSNTLSTHLQSFVIFGLSVHLYL